MIVYLFEGHFKALKIYHLATFTKSIWKSCIVCFKLMNMKLWKFLVLLM